MLRPRIVRSWFAPVVAALALATAVAPIAGCKGPRLGPPLPTPASSTESYGKVVERDFVATTAQPLSTFGLDVDDASYANVRDLLQRGELPPPDAVRVEEFVNAFRSVTPRPDAGPGDDALAVATELQPCPWRQGNWLLRVAVRGRPIAEPAAPVRLVFLLDVSGSMTEPGKLDLVQRAFDVLIESLRPDDHVALVTYNERVAIPVRHASGSDCDTLLEAVAELKAMGSTNGAAGLRAACALARELPGEGPRRVVLITDGDFNVGENNAAGLEQLLAREKRDDTSLSVLGVGRGNLRMTNLEAVAKAGDGSCHFLDGVPAARRLFGTRFANELVCVAKDVKVQVEFHPSRVAQWRLLGYEDRALAASAFADAAADGGEIGAGQTVVAFYELQPAAGTVFEGVALRYAAVQAAERAHAGEVAFVGIAWTPAAGAEAEAAPQQRRCAVRPEALADAPSRAFTAGATAAGFAMLLRDSRHRGGLDWPQLVRMTDHLDHDDVAQHELTGLVAIAARLAKAAD
jgi:Ca-activated chloride channel homolog